MRMQRWRMLMKSLVSLRIDKALALALCVMALLACRQAGSSRQSDAGASASSLADAAAAAAPVASTAASATSFIHCGTSDCALPGQICCEHLSGKKTRECVAAPESKTESGLLTACKTRDSIIAYACDDSGDCPGETICCRPVRHGSDVSFATQECLTRTECDTPERCGKGGKCKRGGCRSDGLCH